MTHSEYNILFIRRATITLAPLLFLSISKLRTTNPAPGNLSSFICLRNLSLVFISVHCPSFGFRSSLRRLLSLFRVPLSLPLAQDNADGLHRSLHLIVPEGLGKLQIAPLAEVLFRQEHVLLLVQDPPQLVQIVKGLSSELPHRPLPTDVGLHPLQSGDRIAKLIQRKRWVRRAVGPDATNTGADVGGCCRRRRGNMRVVCLGLLAGGAWYRRWNVRSGE